MSSVFSGISPLAKDISRFFSKEDYSKKAPCALMHPLSYLIALNQPEDTIIRYIEKLAKSKSDIIDRPSLFFKATPLTIAVMLNKLPIVSALLQAGADPNKEDIFGWTPVIHSALVANAIAETLFAKMGNKEHISKFGGISYDVLKDVTGKTESIEGIERLSIQVNEEIIQSPSKEVLESFMGVQSYRTHSIYHEDHLVNLWSNVQSHEIIDEINLKYAQEALKEPGKKLLIKAEDLSGAATSSLNKGLYADEPIKRGAFLTRYAGKSLAEKPEDSLLNYLKAVAEHRPYLFERVDAQEVGNESRMMNDGWPNVFYLSVGFETYFFASKDIQKGEELLWNYGISEYQLKFGAYALKNKEQMYEMTNEHFDEWLDRLAPLHLIINNPAASKSKKDKAFLSFCSNHAYIKYIFDTPSALLYLFIRGALNLEQIKKVYSLSFIRDEEKTAPPSFLLRMRLLQFLGVLDCVFDSIKSKSLLALVKKAMLDQEGTLDVMGWLTLMRYIMHLVEKQPEKVVEAYLPKLLPDLIANAKKYVFTAFDETCPLHFNVDGSM